MANQLWSGERIANRIDQRLGQRDYSMRDYQIAMQETLLEMRDEYEALLPDAETLYDIRFICDVLQGYDAASIYFRDITAIRKWLERLENT